MNIPLLSILVIVIMTTSCTTIEQNTPITELAIDNLPTGISTLISALSEKSTPTPTLITTPIPTSEIPEFLTPFLEGGYDKKSTDKLLYLTFDESSIHYLPDNGIVFNERIIKSWVYVDYFKDGEYKRDIVLDLVIRGGDGLFFDYGKFVWASSIGAMSTNPSMDFMVRNNNFFADNTPETSHPIMCAPLKYHETGEAQLYEGIFPIVDGKLQPVIIQGIGEVLPISNLFFADSPYCEE